MLANLENILITTLKECFSNHESSTADTIFFKPKENRLTVSVNSLDINVPEDFNTLTKTREQAFLFRRIELKTSGKVKDFPLSLESQEILAEVESPPGNLLRQGEDYFLNTNILSFLQAPAAANPGIVVLIKGAEAQGYKETRSCRVAVHLTVEAKSAEESDALQASALEAILVKLSTLGTIYPKSKSDTVLMRIHDPVASLESITRNKKQSDKHPLYVTQVRILLLGVFELTIATQAPEKAKPISEIVGIMQVIPSGQVSQEQRKKFQVS